MYSHCTSLYHVLYVVQAVYKSTPFVEIEIEKINPVKIKIKPPSFEVLKETRHQSYARSTFDETNSRSFTDDEFKEMIEAGNRIEFLYGHWFDLELVNDDLGGCLESLVRGIRRLDQDAQWVPASWVQ